MADIPALDAGELYRVLAATAQDAIITIDASSTVLSVNPAGERLLGYAAAEIVGSPLGHFIPERFRAAHRAGMLRYLATGTRNIPWQGVRLPILTSAGHEIQTEIAFGEFTSGGHRIFSGILRDLSQRLATEAELARNAEQLRTQAGELEQQVEEAQAISEELEETNAELREANIALRAAREAADRSAARVQEAAGIIETREAEYRALVNSIPTLAWVARADGWINWYNARWYEYTGTTPEQMEGWGWQSVHSPATLGAVLERWQASIATGNAFEMTFPLRGADGLFRDFLTRVVPVRDAEGRVIRWFGTNTDVEVESRLRREAEQANRAKSEFLATMSHELRTPLNAIGGYAELLSLGIHGPVTEEQQEALSRIQRSQRHLLTLINDVLNFAKLEAGSVEYAIADVPVLGEVATLETLVAPQLAAKQLRFSQEQCNADSVVRADPDKLRQILVNLLSNAIKFTNPGGSVVVSCHADAETVRIVVSDTGVGIAADRLEQVFAPFVQIDRRLNTVNEGVGLGLAISRDLARGMNGELSVESVEGEGSSFTISLPRAH